MRSSSPEPAARIRPAAPSAVAVVATAVLATAALVTVVLLTIGAVPGTPLVSAAPAGAPGAASPSHDAPADLERALSAAGTDRESFDRQVVVAERLLSVEAGLVSRFPEAFAGVRLTGTTGRIGVVPDTTGARELTDEIRAAGFTPFPAPRSGAEVAGAVRRLDDWAATLAPEQRGSVLTLEVDHEDGVVTVVVADEHTAPQVPVEPGIRVQRSAFRKADDPGTPTGSGTGSLDPGSSGSGTGSAGTTAPTPSPVPGTGALLGGDRYLTVRPGESSQANWCSLGFHGVYGGVPVTITATHCSEFGPTAAFLPGIVRELADTPVLGRFTTDLADTVLDAAVVTVDPSARSRFANNLVHGSDGAPIRITGNITALPGMTVCKYGFKSGYTCGTSRGVASSTPGLGLATDKVLVDLCGLTGDSGGVMFAGDRAVAITSESNAFRYDPTTGIHTSYPSCADARTGLASTSEVPQLIGVAIRPILDRYPGLSLRTS